MRTLALAKARRRLRQRARGAAMVEALVTIPFFITIFAATMFVGTFYGNKLKSLRESKQCAWQYAMVGCNGACDVAAEGGKGAADGDNLDPPDSNDPSTDGAPGAEIKSGDWYQSKFTVKSSAQASGIMGGFSRDIQSTTTVMCNEEPADGNVIGIAQYVWKNAKGY